MIRSPALAGTITVRTINRLQSRVEGVFMLIAFTEYTSADEVPLSFMNVPRLGARPTDVLFRINQPGTSWSVFRWLCSFCLRENRSAAYDVAVTSSDQKVGPLDPDLDSLSLPTLAFFLWDEADILLPP